MNYQQWKAEREHASAAYDRLSRSVDFVIRGIGDDRDRYTIFATVQPIAEAPGFVLCLTQPYNCGQLDTLGELTEAELAMVVALHRDFKAWVRGVRDMPEPGTWRP